MIITTAYAALPRLGGRSELFPMHMGTTGAFNGLVRLMKLKDGTPTSKLAQNPDWISNNGVNAETWADQSHDLLKGLADGQHDVDANGADGAGADMGNLRSEPWYSIFEVKDQLAIGQSEIWAGRFFSDAAQTPAGVDFPLSESFEVQGGEPGVYFFYAGQSTIRHVDGVPQLAAIRAIKSMTFASLSTAQNSTSAAKEQGCTLDDTSGMGNDNTEWPVMLSDDT